MEIYNTLGRSLQPFVPREPGKVGLYACGATVQARPHLGHGRMAVVFDVVRNYLEWRGFDVLYVRNVTDVDDKIIAAANERGTTIDQVVAESNEAFDRAYGGLGVRSADIEPRATEHVTDMIAMVTELVDRGFAYEVDGDVYFSVRDFEGYGRLSGRDIDELESGARVAPDERKRDPLDFALWKAAKPGEPEWDSPWGPGRPGWHIECSAMSIRYLGFGFDIHGGGNDLVFPHHENEIAQAEAAAGAAPFARYWMHNGMLNLGGEKMAKSTGHVVDLLDALEEYPPLSMRLFYLRTHYRKPLDFSREAVLDAAASLERLWAFRRRVGLPSAEPEPAVIEGFRVAMDDDFDMAGALGVLFDAVREGNRLLDRGGDAGTVVAAYDEIVGVLGLAEPVTRVDDLAGALTSIGRRYELSDAEPGAVLTALLERRDAARAERDFATADALRNELAAIGIVIEDTDDGSRWHRG